MAQRYIPGLNARPDDIEMPPKPKPETANDILVKEMLSGRKNAAMALHEYCARNKIKLAFMDEPVDMTASNVYGSFAVRAFLDDEPYPQGVGGTKKEAKTEASRLALRAYAGIDEYQPVTLTPELDTNRFQEVRDVGDIVEQQGLMFRESVTKNLQGMTVCLLSLGGYDSIEEKHPDRDTAVQTAYRKALNLLKAQHEQEYPGFQAAAAMTAGNYLCPNPKLAGLREKKTFEILDKMMESLPSKFSTMDHCVASIFRSESFKSLGVVVALATGSTSISAEHLTLDGRCILDSNCVTMVKRAFRKYLAQEMLKCYRQEASVFERRPDDPSTLRIKEHIRFDLFLSQPPDGDYKEFLHMKSECSDAEMASISEGGHIPWFTEDTHGMFRCRNDEGMVELTDQTPDQTSVVCSKMANEIWVMTASDKLLRMNILGIQGASLSHFTDPVYLSSITIGYNSANDHGNLARSVCCRVYNDLIEELPKPYIINHPVLNFSPSPARASQGAGSTHMSSMDHVAINYCATDARIEVIQGQTGRTHPESPFKVSTSSPNSASRLCKAGWHLKWFSDLCKACGSSRLQLTGPNTSPAQAKSKATTYLQAKKAFLDHCAQNNVGKWMHVPIELSMFTK